jgi:hypothetical protein
MEQNLIFKIWGFCLKTFLLVGCIFYLPFKGGDADPVAHGYWAQEMFFRYGSIALIVLSQLVQPIRRLDCKYLVGFFIYMIASSLILGFGANLRHSLLNCFVWMMLYKVIYENFDFSKIKEYAFLAGLILFVNLGMCAMQYNGKDLIFSNASHAIPYLMDTVIGFMRVKAFLGILCAIAFPIVAVFAPIFSLCVI